MKIDLAFTYEALKSLTLNTKVIVTIDVLRATTTMTTALYHNDLSIIPVREIEKAVERHKNFLARIFTENEIEYFNKKNMRAETIAGYFAAKEAIGKAMGTGIYEGNWKNIEIIKDDFGKILSVIPAPIRKHITVNFQRVWQTKGEEQTQPADPAHPSRIGGRGVSGLYTSPSSGGSQDAMARVHKKAKSATRRMFATGW